MNVLIIEDEELAARNLLSILQEIGDLKAVAVLESIVDSIEWFELNKCPDLVFMDIHLADGSSFEIFKHVKINCPVIFTTAYDEYALQAFKVNSIDYLLKPIDVAEVRRALVKLENFTKSNGDSNEYKKLLSMLKPDIEYKTHFLVLQKGDKLVPLTAESIACVFIDVTVVKALTYEGKSFSIQYSLDELVTMLNPKDFFRANRQFIIARDAIQDLDLWFNGRLSVNLKVTVSEKILISKARIPEFKTWFS